MAKPIDMGAEETFFDAFKQALADANFRYSLTVIDQLVTVTVQGKRNQVPFTQPAIEFRFINGALTSIHVEDNNR